MPRDSNGSYSLPVGYLAVTGEPILASQHNPPLEDLAAAMTTSLPRTGVAPMTAALKAYAGTSSAPGVAFATGPTTGIYLRSDGGLGLSSAGTVVGFVPIGMGVDFWGTTAPTGWLFPYGQAVSRTTYAALFAVLGTTYGSGDGSTTFNLPDKRDRASFGKGDMGGTSADRITNQTDGWEGDTLGAAGGKQTGLISQANIPNYNLSLASLTWSGTVNGIPGGALQASSSGNEGVGFNNPIISGGPGVTVTGTIGGTLPSGGSGTALNNLPPGIVCNYIIFTGVF